MKIKIGKPNTIIPPGNEYRAYITEIKESNTYKRKALEFTFEIDTPEEFAGTELRGFCNADYEVFTNRTKLVKWLEVAIGKEFEAGDEIDLDEFKEKLLRISVETKTSKRTKMEFSNVTDILELELEL